MPMPPDLGNYSPIWVRLSLRNRERSALRYSRHGCRSRRLHFERRSIVQCFLVTTCSHKSSRQQVTQFIDSRGTVIGLRLGFRILGIRAKRRRQIRQRDHRLHLRVLMRIDERLELIDSQHSFREVSNVAPEGRRIWIDLLQRIDVFAARERQDGILAGQESFDSRIRGIGVG
jgi:hypothetical protein